MDNALSHSDIISLEPTTVSDTVNLAYSIFADKGNLKMAVRSVKDAFQDKPMVDLIMDMVRTRKRSRTKFPRGEELFFTSEGLRWATPEIAADHCARRFQGDVVVDVTCGQGGQALSFSKYSDQVIANDIDPLNTLITRLNSDAMGFDNIEIRTTDCLSDDFVGSIPKGCRIFSDPARPAGSRERDLGEITPDPRAVHIAFRDIASGFCFEVPPYISLDRIPFDCEEEYISIDGRVNRLNLYLGDLKRSERSAVILPGGSSIEGAEEAFEFFTGSDLPGDIVYEVDPTLVRAGLISKMMSDPDIHGAVIKLDKRRTLLVSDSEVVSPFLKKGYRLIGISTEDSLIQDLKDAGAGSVTLRWELDPDDYWKVRKGIEKELNGSRKIQIFRWNGYMLLE